MLILSGNADPIGEYGRGTRRLLAEYEARGYSDATMILYPGARHELLNETNREQVTADILIWMEARLGTTSPGTKIRSGACAILTERINDRKRLRRR